MAKMWQFNTIYLVFEKIQQKDARVEIKFISEDILKIAKLPPNGQRSYRAQFETIRRGSLYKERDTFRSSKG